MDNLESSESGPPATILLCRSGRTPGVLACRTGYVSNGILKQVGFVHGKDLTDRCSQ